MNTPSSVPRVALLVDADNVTLNYLVPILKLSDSYGELKISHAYRDWKKPPLSSPHHPNNELNIKRVQVDRVGKNATDHQLMIDAGQILGANKADIFIIASGDGDFCLLCKTIKSKNRKVVVIGNKEQTSENLKRSCDTFYPVEELEEILTQLAQYPVEERKEILTQLAQYPVEERKEILTQLAQYPVEERKEILTQLAQYPVEEHKEMLTQLAQYPVEERKEILTQLAQYPVEERKEILTQLAQYPVEEHKERLTQLARLREFKALVLRAFKLNDPDKEGWIALGGLGSKLLELNPEYKKQFGVKKLSQTIDELWWVHLSGNRKKVRVLDSKDWELVKLLRKELIQAFPLGSIPLDTDQLRQILHKLESEFGEEKLSKWLKEYPDLFKGYQEYRLSSGQRLNNRE